MYFIKTPFFAKCLYPSLVWDIPNEENKIFLTFDDGVNETLTPFILNELKKYDFKATFFLVGENCERYPQQVKAILDNGHQIGNHSFNHLNGWQTADDMYLENIRQAQIYTQTPLFRPPYGKIRRSQIKKLQNFNYNYKIIMWSLMAGDFDTKISAKICLQRLKKYTKAGDIIVLHDNIKFEHIIKNILPDYLAFCAEKGFILDIVLGREEVRTQREKS